MKRVARLERRGSEFNTSEIPVSKNKLSWRLFNIDFYSTDRSYKEIVEIANVNLEERIDLRHYIIEDPHTCFTTDRLQKVLDTFRNNNLRILCVVNPVDGSLQGLISREDLFAYMSL